mgnify:CR=1 FL=1
MNLCLSMSKALSLCPDREAIVDHHKRFTYRDFGKRVANLSQCLLQMELKQGEAVAILSHNCHEYMEIYYACAATGIVLVPLNYRLSALEIASILADAEAKALFVHPALAPVAEELLGGSYKLSQVIWLSGVSGGAKSSEGLDYEEMVTTGSGEFPGGLPWLKQDDLAQLYYTSGTTGRPKGVMLSHGNVAFNALGAIAELSLSDADTWIHAAPLFHLADAWSIFALTWVGAKHVFVSQFQSTEVLQAIEQESVTLTVLVPTMLNALLADERVGQFSYRTLRLILTGGSPIAPEVVKKTISTFGCEYVQLYGMTETSPFLTLSLPKFNQRELSENEQIDTRARTGRPYIGAEVKVVRADGNEVLRNNVDVGEIIARGPTVTLGYWKQPEATAETIRNGWIYTGDLAVLDEHGSINIVDRQKDMIISGGENVYSTEVEYALYEHPSVQECAVFGVPDERWGEAVQAAVVKRLGFESVSDIDIIDFVRQRLARYKAPRSIEFYSELPKTGSGKIYKKALREKHWQGRVKQVN